MKKTSQSRGLFFAGYPNSIKFILTKVVGNFVERSALKIFAKKKSQ